MLQKGEETFLTTVYKPDGVTKTLHGGAAGWSDRKGDENSLLCQEDGEKMTVVEHFLPHPRMIIFGGGHIAVPLSQMASLLEFKATVFDDRPSFANRARFPWADVICESFQKIPQCLSFRRSDYIVIVTRGHRHDTECLRSVLSGEPPYYVGMIGSRRRVAIVRRQMTEEKFPQERINALHSPIGLDIGAVTPEEIAVSILAEAVQEKRRSGSTLRRRRCYADMTLMESLAAETSEKMALITVLSTEGSTPREAGAKMAVLYDGRSIGSIGGGCADADVSRDARDIILSGGYRSKTVDMTDSAEDDGMVCGGKMRVLIEAV
jgi:xanthine dehydrogenase accessory factor